MKKILFLLIYFTGTITYAPAQDLTGWGISLGCGQSTDSIDIYRAGLVKQLNVKWLENKIGHVRGYFELSYNRWEYGGDDINAVALSPVFQYLFQTKNRDWYPYIEAGTGVAWLDDYTIHDRDLSTTLQFENRAGAGIRVKNIDFSFRYMHYSNASLKGPNDGIDILIGTLVWCF